MDVIATLSFGPDVPGSVSREITSVVRHGLAVILDEEVHRPGERLLVASGKTINNDEQEGVKIWLSIYDPASNAETREKRLDSMQRMVDDIYYGISSVEIEMDYVEDEPPLSQSWDMALLLTQDDGTPYQSISAPVYRVDLAYRRLVNTYERRPEVGASWVLDTLDETTREAVLDQLAREATTSAQLLTNWARLAA